MTDDTRRHTKTDNNRSPEFTRVTLMFDKKGVI